VKKKKKKARPRYEIVARIFRNTTMPLRDWKEQIATELRELGNSLDIHVNHSGKKAVIHIHTNAPEEVKIIITAFSKADTTPRFEEQDLEEQVREVQNV